MYGCFSTQPHTSAVPTYFTGVIVVKSLGLLYLTLRILQYFALFYSLHFGSLPLHYYIVFLGYTTGGYPAIDCYPVYDMHEIMHLLTCNALSWGGASPALAISVDTPQVQERATQSQLVWYGLWCGVHQPLAQEAKEDTGSGKGNEKGPSEIR